VNNKKYRKWCTFVLPLLFITLMSYLCSEWTPNFQIIYFMFDWSIYRLFVLNSAWKRDSLQIMTFVYVCSTWNLVERKTRSETWITRNYKLVSHFLFNNTYCLLVITINTKCPNQVFYVWLFDLQTLCLKHVLETSLSPNDDIRKCLLDMKNGWSLKRVLRRE
jgi:hypothetical protein